MTLKEKIQSAAEQGSDPEEAAAILKNSLSAAENGKVWPKHQTFLKHNRLEKGQFEALDKKSKGMAAALWLVQHDPSARGYLHTSQSVNCGECLEKDDTWKSETKMLQEWTWEELQAHLGSGRILWKEDEYTPGGCMSTRTPSLGKDSPLPRGTRSGRWAKSKREMMRTWESSSSFMTKKPWPLAPLPAPGRATLQPLP